MDNTANAGHPLTSPRMAANYGLLAFTGIGVALMSVQIFLIGAVICAIAVIGIVSLYWSDLKRLRFRLVGGALDNEPPSRELLMALGVVSIAIIAPVSIYFYMRSGQSDEIAVLREQASMLTANRWEPLAPNEIISLRTTIRPMAPQPFSVACNFDSCNDLGKSLYDVFQELKWPGTRHMGLVNEEFGLHIYSANEATAAVVEAIENATKGRLKIETHMQRTGWAARDNEIVLSIGRKK